MALLEACPVLERLHLPFCANLTEHAFGAMPVFCPVLSDLDLTGCSSISRMCIEQLTSELPRLMHLRAYGLHHALSNFYDGPDTPQTPRTVVSRLSAASGNGARYPWSTIDGSVGLNATAQHLLRRGLVLDYWPPPGVSHRIAPASFRRNPQHEPVTLSLGGLEYMCECGGTRCIHGCGAVLPRCLEEDHLQVCPRAPVPCLLVGLGCRTVVDRESYHIHLRTCKANVVICTTCYEPVPRLDLEVHLMQHVADHSLRTQQGCPLRNEGCTARCDNPIQHLSHECRYYIMRCSMCSAVVLRSQLAQHSCVVRRIPMPHLGAPMIPSMAADRTVKYVRQSPTSSPQMSRTRMGSGRRQTPLAVVQRALGRAVPPNPASMVGAMVLRWEALKVARPK